MANKMLAICVAPDLAEDTMTMDTCNIYYSHIHHTARYIHARSLLFPCCMQLTNAGLHHIFSMPSLILKYFRRSYLPNKEQKRTQTKNQMYAVCTRTCTLYSSCTRLCLLQYVRTSLSVATGNMHQTSCLP